MSEQDTALQEYLQRMEEGAPLEEILSSLPPQHANLAPLLQTASTLKRFPHPGMSPHRSREQRERVLRPLRRWEWQFLNFRIQPAVAIVVAVLLIAFASVMLIRPTSVHTATLLEVQGVVEVLRNGEWQPVSEGERVQEGEHIRTRADSSAVLLYPEGSRTTLNADTTLELATLNTQGGKVLQLRLEQTSGETRHSVVPFRNSSAFFEVNTPSGKAVVHGTIFSVLVNDQMFSRIAVERGVVQVVSPREDVKLTAGQVTVVDDSGEVDDPAVDFFIQGQISTISGDVWTIAGLNILVPPDLAATLSYQVGDWVRVWGRILPDGTRVADRFDYAVNDKEKLRFTGVVESMAADQWVISGIPVYINAETEIEGTPQVGDVVHVAFIILEDGTWLAKEIEQVEEEEQPTPTTEPSETPELTLTPEITPTLEATPTVEPTQGTRAGCDAGDKQHPEGLRLAERYGVPYEEIMGWFCRGYGFGEIDLAYEMSVQSGMPVTDIFAMRESGMGWGNIKKAVEVTATPEVRGKPEKTPKPKITPPGKKPKP
ncbi:MULTISPECIES: DUF5666 domain-containing protein [Anaerolinea]|uniref:DUF5666 domain-containing protein n=1 Tax=Anaerolinea TaxID=233189 RepID=UPI0026396C66|nr:DUF5666 domain-containing protein [Anaerolinea thermophila]